MLHLPSRFTELRPHQSEAVERIADAWTRSSVVIWQAPTGTGKTIGAVAAAVQARAAKLLYVCSGLQLQEQFGRDFPSAVVLKGRSNYPSMRRGYTAADCNRMGKGENAVCSFCDPVADCLYLQTKAEAIRADLACINIPYLLTEANGPGGFSSRACTVIDEADELEGQLMRHLEFRIGERTAREMGMAIPKKGVHQATIEAWLKDVTRRAGKMAARIEVPEGHTEFAARAQQIKARWARLASDAARMGRMYGDNWVRTYDRSEFFQLKPVTVAEYGQKMVWRHADKWLVMSATVLSPARFAEDLGITDYEYVETPSVFEAARRPVVVCGVGPMTKKDQPETLPKMVDAVNAIVNRHEGENVLVHTHTYQVARAFEEGVRVADGREVMLYGKASERERIVRRFRDEGGVLLAPSLARGVDLPDDACRVVIIAKIPFPYLGDPQISARMHQEGGQVWYDMLTVREIVQMTGRGMRHEGDWAVTYVLDGSFLKGVWKRKALFPAWWREAVQVATARQVLAGDVELAGIEGLR